MAITLATPVSEIELVPGNAIRLKDLTWLGYMALLQELGDRRLTRVTFDNGVLEIRMPGQLHEIINRVLAAIILTLAEMLDLPFNNLGSTRLNRPDLVQGIEPDSCFYIQNAQDGQGMLENTDLPPDLAIGVNIASSSAQELSIYGAMGVGEIWLYQQERLAIKVLQGDGQYAEVQKSVAFPVVSTEQLNGWIELRKTVTDLTVIKAVRSAMMSRDGFKGLQETAHLLKFPANVAHLENSMAQFKGGEIVEQKLLDGEGD